jgi:hypothetical protein
MRGAMAARVRTALLLAVVTAALPATADEVPESYRLEAENERLAFRFDRTTGEFAVIDKATGTVRFSNPRDAGAAARGVFSIFYGVPGADQVEMNDRDGSVELGQCTVAAIPGGIRATYVLGRPWRPIAVVPQLIAEDRYADLVSRIADPADRAFVEQNYGRFMLERRPVVRPGESAPTAARPRWWQFWKKAAGEAIDIGNIRTFERQLFGGWRLVSLATADRERQKVLDDMEVRHEQAVKAGSIEDASALQAGIDGVEPQFDLDRGALLWPMVEKYIGRNVSLGAAAAQRGFRADILTADGLTPAEFEPFHDAPTYVLLKNVPLVVQDLERIFGGAGYTIDDLRADNLRYRLDPPVPAIERFTIVVEYRLEGGSLVVRVPLGEARFPMNVPTSYRVDFGTRDPGKLLVFNANGTKESRPLYSLSLLRYFGCAGTDAAGSIFVPDGCGALIALNAEKETFPVYSEPVYGRDRAVSVDEVLPYDKRSSLLPVFGISRGDRALFAVIEQGDALASVRADVARSASPWNIVYASFDTMPRTRITSGQVQLTVFQQRAHQGDLQVRYFFLEGEDAGYAGMARRYRQYLEDRGDLAPLAAGARSPVYLDLVGAISDVRTVGLVPARVSIPLTTFAQAGDIAADLGAAGVTGLKLRLAGWLAGGLHSAYPRAAAPERALGGRAGLGGLAARLAAAGVELFPDVSLTTVWRDTWFDGFRESRDASRFLNRLPAAIPRYDVVTGNPLGETAFRVLSPARLPRLLDGFLAGYRRTGADGLSLADLGRTLDSDFRESERRLVDRQQALDIERAQWERLAAAFPGRLMAEGAGEYAFRYVDHLVDMPDSMTGVGIADREVPFLQMVLHGAIPYAGSPINLAPDPARALLRCVEYGAAPRWRLFAADPSLVKGTEFADLFDAAWPAWRDRVAAWSRRLDADLGGLAAERIVDHREAGPGVFQTVYGNGAVVTVNYGDVPVTVDGRTVGALDYSVSAGGGR